MFFDTRQHHPHVRSRADRQVAQTTVRGALAAYLVPDASVKHVLGSAVAKVVPTAVRRVADHGGEHDLELRSPPRRRRRHRRVPASMLLRVGPAVAARRCRGAGAATRSDDRPAAGRADAARSAYRRSAAPRAAPHARAAAEQSVEAVRVRGPLAAVAQVLASWAAAHEISAGFQLEAMLLADGLTTSSSAAMEAAEKLAAALEFIAPCAR